MKIKIWKKNRRYQFFTGRHMVPLDRSPRRAANWREVWKAKRQVILSQFSLNGKDAQ